MSVEANILIPVVRDVPRMPLTGLTPEQAAGFGDKIVENARASGLAISYDQTGDVRDLLTRCIKDGVSMPVPSDFFGASQREKLALAGQGIEAILAKRLLEMAQEPVAQTAIYYRSGFEMNRLITYLGGQKEQSKEEICRWLQDLPDEERALAYAVLSPNLLESLGWPDLEECGEERAAHYLAHASYDGFGIGVVPSAHRDSTTPTEKSVRDLEVLMTAVTERDGGNLDAGKVIEYLCQRDSAPNLFNRMLEAAIKGGFVEDALQFFNSHPKTRCLARQCEEELGISIQGQSLEDLIDEGDDYEDFEGE